MVSLSSTASLLVAVLAASAQVAVSTPQEDPAQGNSAVEEPNTGSRKEGEQCSVDEDRIICADESSLLICNNNKWMALATCTTGTVCKDGNCVYPDESAADIPQNDEANESSPVVDAPSVPGLTDTGAALVPTAESGASDTAAVPGETDVAATDGSDAAGTEEGDTAATEEGDTAATEGDDTAAAGSASSVMATDTEPSDVGASDTGAEEESSADGSGGGEGASGDNFGITCDKFTEAVSKASEAIGQSYPKPTDAQCKSFLKGMPKGDLSSAREAAMFLANILWESDGLQAKEEYDCQDKPDWCAQNYKTPEDESGKTYWGRGYIQLTWHYNYIAASEGLYGDDTLAKDPEKVASDEDTAWAVSFWFWKENVHSDPGVQAGNFGSSINKINGALECKGAAQDKAKKRYEMYKAILPIFAPDEEPKESGCYN